MGVGWQEGVNGKTRLSEWLISGWLRALSCFFSLPGELVPINSAIMYLRDADRKLEQSIGAGKPLPKICHGATMYQASCSV